MPGVAGPRVAITFKVDQSESRVPELLSILDAHSSDSALFCSDISHVGKNTISVRICRSKGGGDVSQARARAISYCRDNANHFDWESRTRIPF
jgi:hypothetical protein